jgi:DedD protein
MGLLSALNRPASNTGSAASPADVVEAARIKARRRLVGAAVMLGIGVIAFPLIFETQPRPIPVDIAISIPKRDEAKPLAMPQPAAAPKEAPAPAGDKPAPPGKKLPDIVEKAEPPKPLVAAATAAAPKAQESKPQPGAAASAPAAPGALRLVIQIGAFAEDEAMREARGKVEKLGLKTYIQTVDTKEGKRTRVRVGPYSSREELDQAAGKLKSVGITVSVLEL